MYYGPWMSKATGTTGLVLLASIIYGGGVCPTIYWFDSPEFVTTAYGLDISHPTGSPVYSLLAKLLTFLPFGSVALRVNLFSVLTGIGCIVLLFHLLYELLGVTSRPWIRWLAALGGALFLLVSVSFWRFAEVAEVYVLQNCFLLLLIFVLTRARAQRETLQPRYYWLFAFLYGLSAGVHATMAFFLPAFFVFLGLTARRMFRPREMAFLAFFFLLGFAAYLYLPLRSLTEPALNWGEPQTWRQFLIHITDRKDSSVHTVFFLQQLPYQIFMYLVHLTNEFAILGCAMGFVGFLAVWRRDKPFWAMLFLALLGHTAFFIRTWWDTAWGFIPSFVIFAIWVGYGIHACLEWVETLYRRHPIRLPRVAVHTVVCGGLVMTLLQTYTRHEAIANQAANYSTELYGKQLLEQLPPDAILFCEYAWFPLLYLQQVERQRPDLSTILQGEVLFPTYYKLISEKRFPNIQHVKSDAPVVISTAEYFWLLARLNAKDHPLFWDPAPKNQRHLSEHLVPEGLLFRLHPSETVAVTPEILRDHWQRVSRSISRILQGRLEDSATFFLAHKLNQIASHLRHIGAMPEAVHTYEAILSLRPLDKITRNNYGAMLLAQGKFPEALEQFNVVYAEDPINPILNENIGALLLRLEDPLQAASFLEKAVAFGNTTGKVYAQLGEAYAKMGRYDPALRALQMALGQWTTQATHYVGTEQAEEQLSVLRDWIQYVEGQLQSSRSAGDGQ
ncbi:MAG: DUF2723 domain-containing protein [Candidatus Tectimicrobiota bacterium]